MIYISGPMTGYPLNNYPAFDAAAAKLREDGHQVLCPSELPAPADTSWHGWMRAALRMMLDADTVAMLPGWEKSSGACIEYMIARWLKYQIIYL